MSFYLAWGAIPYIVWVIFLMACLYGLFRLTRKVRKEAPELSEMMTWARILGVLLLAFLLQFPIHHDSTKSQNYRLHFNNDVEYTSQQIEKSPTRESWEERSKREREESEKSSEQRLGRALDSDQSR